MAIQHPINQPDPAPRGAKATGDAPKLECAWDNCIVRVLKYKVVIAGMIEVIGDASRGGFIQSSLVEIIATGPDVVKANLRDIVYIPTLGGITFPSRQLQVKLISEKEILAWDRGNVTDAVEVQDEDSESGLSSLELRDDPGAEETEPVADEPSEPTAA